jgi:hypothetical protein
MRLVDGSAITAMTATQLNYEAMRGFGLTCADPTPNLITVRRHLFRTSIPTQNQGIYLFAENTEDTQADDVWYDYVIDG